MDHSVNSHVSNSNVVLGAVWYEGTDALFEGEAVCYNTDYGTATAVDGRRNNKVERPSTSNSKAFAGVAARNYSAKSGGQLVEIHMPGSRGVKVALAIDTVIGTGMLTFQAGGGTGAGRFYTGKYAGRGSVIPRQTVTAVIESSMIGAWSLEATAGLVLTVTDTTGLAAGDTVVLVGGENDGTGVLVPGKYTIASVPAGGTTLVLATTPLSTLSTGAITCTGYAYTGNPTCQADLLTGDESGGIQFLSPPNAGGAGLAYMTSGVSYICGGVTLAVDSDVTFAQGTLPGQKKAFICLGTLTTKDVVIDLATNGIQIDGSSALAEVNAFNAAADAAYLQFNGALWHCMDVVGGATEA